jgi:predicted SAM-dependent methyltransferase
MIKFDLGGTRDHNEYKAVNFVGYGSIKANILELDSFCYDNTVDEFYMSHTYEHINPIDIPKFLNDILRKLKIGGILKIKHTDAKKCLDLYNEKIIDFRALRDLLFTSYPRRKKIHIDGFDLNGHKYMWGEEELMEELLYYGFSDSKTYNAGSWKFDFENYFPNDNMQNYHGILIPNLGIIGIK